MILKEMKVTTTGMVNSDTLLEVSLCYKDTAEEEERVQLNELLNYQTRMLENAVESSQTVNHLSTVFFFFLFGAVPAAYGRSQAGGQDRAAAAGLCYSHSNLGSEPHL